MSRKPKIDKTANLIGQLVRRRRTEAGLTQKELAERLGLGYITMISQIENEYVAVPPALWTKISKALNFEGSEFVTLCLWEYQPEIYRALFGDLGKAEVDEVLGRLSHRLH